MNPAMGPLNRRGFTAHAEQQIERSGDLRLAGFDIDRFKRTNDVNKHGTRDEVLCTCAQVAKTLARKLKPAASLSGEELVIVLSDSTLEQAMTICERLRKLIENEVTIVEDRSIKVTMSGGTTEFVKNSAIDAMLAAAELAQYERNGQEGIRLPLRPDTKAVRRTLSVLHPCNGKFFTAGCLGTGIRSIRLRDITFV
jgi:diguanylate cyclase (GGDEF)-like protein